MSMLVFGFAFVATFPVTDRSYWNAILLATLWGVGCYTILFFLVPFFLSLPFIEAVVAKFSPVNWFIEIDRFRLRTGILIGGSVGVLVGTAYWNWRQKKDFASSPIPRPFLVGPILMGVYGMAQVLAFTCETTFAYRNVVFFPAFHQRPSVEEAARSLLGQAYPFDAERWFAVHWNEDYFAISYPSLILVGLLVAGGLAGWYRWQAKKPAGRGHAVDPLGADP